MSIKVLDALKERFGEAILDTHSQHGDDTAVATRERIIEVLTYLRDDAAMKFDHPTDLTCVDFLGREPRFEVVYHLFSTTMKHRIRLKVRVAEEDPTVPSATPLYSGWNWF